MGFAKLSRLEGLMHAVTTRRGGVSREPFDSLNLGHGQDSPESVERNLELLREALGLKRLVYARQVHGTRIVAVNGKEGAAAAEADGLATDQPGVGLLIKQADCQAVVLAAPQKGVAANLHVGWRGNVANMPGAGVAFLREAYGVSPELIHAAVSPSLGACCAEFVNADKEFPAHFEQYRVGENHFDLWRITKDQLTEAGVRPERIEVSGLCTRCGKRFFSYRREKLTGRFGTVVALV